MTLQLENELLDVIARLRSEAVQDAFLSKDEQRRRLLRRKKERLLQHRARLRAQEKTMLAQLQRIDYSRIRPVLRWVKPEQYDLFLAYRQIASSAPYTGRPGRMLRMWCIDEESKSPLGVIEVGSDLQSLLPRDQWFGWTREQKFAQGGLQRIANVSTCVAIAPFGLLCGGKYLADGLVVTDAGSMYDVWQRKYGDVLGALTITSLYGKSSIYNRLPTIQYLGVTTGQGAYHLTPRDYALLKAFAQEKHRTGRTVNRTFLTSSRNDLLDVLCTEFKVDRSELATPTPKGVYIAPLVDNPQAVVVDNDDPEPVVRSAADARAYWYDRWYTMRRANGDVWRDVLRFDPESYRVDTQIELCG
jgi:hypothetical protein